MKLRAAFTLLAVLMLLSGCNINRVGLETVDKSDSCQNDEGTVVFDAPEGTVLGALPMSEKEVSEAIAEREYIPASEIGLVLFYDCGEIPALADGQTFYLTADENREETTKWGSGCLSANINCTLAFAEADISAGLDTIMREGIKCRLYAFSGGFYTTAEIIFTTLPVIKIDTANSNKITAEDVKCTLSVFTPRNDLSVARTDHLAAKIHVRGATSASMPKTSYKLTLHNDDYTSKTKLPLLGMRNDDDWILYASYSDESKVRDATGWWLWEKIGAYTAGGSARGTVSLRYTEVILNGRYNGFYIFMERLDQKTLGLGSGDALFVVKTWTVPPSEKLRMLSVQNTYYEGVERKYPKPEDAAAGSGWEDFANFVSAVYESDEMTFLHEIDKAADIDNMLDYWLFLQIIIAQDNHWKNTFYASFEGQIHAFPWDLDVTFGLGWNSQAKNFLFRSNASDKLFDFKCGRMLIDYYPGAVAYLQARWKELLNDGIVTAENINAVANRYWDELQKSGAYKRNLARWPQTSSVEDLEFFEATMENRIAFLDSYITDLKDAVN